MTTDTASENARWRVFGASTKVLVDADIKSPPSNMRKLPGALDWEWKRRRPKLRAGPAADAATEGVESSRRVTRQLRGGRLVSVKARCTRLLRAPGGEVKSHAEEMTKVGEGVYKSVRSRALARAVEEFRALTSFVRMLPSFIIVGGQRCGTNSLYEYLVAHPNVRRALPGQEVHFFDLHMDRGMSWYRGHYPIWVRSHGRGAAPFITGECSPYYMFHPTVPLPHIKLFVLLRIPVDRAFSHYQHELARGYETLPFDEAIDREPEQLEGEEQKTSPNDTSISFNHQHFSYAARGRYADQLETLLSLFLRQNIMILVSEELFGDPAANVSMALRFLELPAFSHGAYLTHNPGSYTDMDPGLRVRLTEHLAEKNKRLYLILDTNFRWD